MNSNLGFPPCDDPWHPLVSPALVVIASAGSGKTTRLTTRVASLLLAGVKPRNILATTFTRKAASEIQRRVIDQLAYKTASGDDRAAQQAFRHLLQEQHRLNFVTIDAWVLRLARLFAHELELPPKLTPTPASAVATQSAQVITDVILNEGKSGAVDLVVEALRQNNSDNSVVPLLARFLSEGLELLLTLPEASWQFAKDLLREGIATSLSPTDVTEMFHASELPKTKRGDFDKRWVDLRKRLLLDLGNKQPFTDGCAAQKAATIAANGRYAQREPTESFLAACHAYCQLGRKLVLARVAERTEILRQVLTTAEAIVRQAQIRSGSIGFSDIKALLVRRGVAGRLATVQFRLDGEVHHLLLDEFQDTSALDWGMLFPIAHEIMAHADGERSFFCVGDPKQAIFGWRGGSASLINEVTTSFESNGLKKEPLTVCYRCPEPVVSFVNHVMGSLPQYCTELAVQEAAPEFVADFEPHQSNNNGAGFVEYIDIVSAPSCDNTAGENDDDETNFGTEGESEERNGEESDKNFFEGVSSVAAALYQEANGASVGVLVRRTEEADALIPHLRAKLPGVSVQGEVASCLVDDVTVAAILNLLRFIEHPGDTRALASVLATPLNLLPPLSRFTAHELTAAATRSRGEAARQLKCAIAALSLEGALIEWSNLLVSHGPPYSAESVLKVASLAATHDRDRTGRLASFLTRLETERLERAPGRGVRVLTMHGAKGLEFPLVVLVCRHGTTIPPRHGGSELFFTGPGGSSRSSYVVTAAISAVEKALVPELKKIDERKVRAKRVEELRLLYVALTRAQTGLIICGEQPAKGSESKRDSFASILKRAWQSWSRRRELATDKKLSLDRLRRDSPSRELDSSRPEQAAPVTFAHKESATRRTAPKEVKKEAVRVVNLDATARGALIHRALAAVSWVEGPNPPSSWQGVSELEEAWLNPEFRRLFSPNSVTGDWSVWPEREFAHSDPMDGTVHFGRFDRLIMSPDRTQAAVVEFKLAHFPPAADQAAAHHSQIRRYAYALRRMYRERLQRVSLALAYLPSGNVVAVAE